ncbi:MAG: flagellar hook-length control protein FliK [Candidatus Saganbacteria bacterium]|nr:flagellar hook-length control protein FliK [Candidatus Saganbacteria bacterium]
MSAHSVPSKQINESHLSGNSSAKNRADGSFNKRLNMAQEKLEKKNKFALTTPWAQIEKLFNISRLEFDFNFSAADIKKDPSKQNESYSANQHEPAARGEDARKPIEQTGYEFKNTQVLKEVLCKNIPPQMLGSISGLFFGLGSDFQQSPMKPSLQLIINEIVKQAKLVKSGQKTELSLSLAQKELGEMLITITMKNGHLFINIIAAAETKKMLESNLGELELALKESDIALDSIKIEEVKHGRPKQSHS